MGDSIQSLGELKASARLASANLLENFNFEDGLINSIPSCWKYDRRFVSIVDDKLNIDNKCLEIKTDGALQNVKIRNGMPYIIINYLKEIEVKGDSLYSVSFDSYSPKYGIGYPAMLYINWYDKAGQPCSLKEISVSAAKREGNTWLTTQNFVTSPKDAVKAEIYFATWALGTKVFIDNVSFCMVSNTINSSIPKQCNPLRVMYGEEIRDNPDDAQRVKTTGFTHIAYKYWKCYEPKRGEDLEYNLGLAKSLHLNSFVTLWLSEISPPDFRRKQPLIDFHGNEHKRTPSIFHKEWWDSWFIPTVMRVVNKSQKYNIKGILIDFELYDTPNRIEDVCYCDLCLSKFSALQNITIQGKTITEKTRWLLDNAFLSSYRKFQEDFLVSKLNELRRKTDEVNPTFQFGNLPYYDFLVDRVFIERLGTKEARFIVAVEKTFDIQSEAYSDTTGICLAMGYILSMREMLSKRGYNFVILGGVSPRTSIDFMEKKINRLNQICDGYWFFKKSFIDSVPILRNKKNYWPITREKADMVWDALRKINH